MIPAPPRPQRVVLAATALTILVLVLVLVAGALVLSTGRQTTADDEPVVTRFAYPATIAAGEPLTVTVWSTAPDGAVLPVSVLTGMVAVERTVTIAAGTGSLHLDGDDVRRSGVVTLAGPGPDGPITRQIRIVAGAPEGDLTPLVGPRSIVADGVDHTMIVAIPTDRFGNPVADGTAVSVQARRPSGWVDTATMTTVHGLAATTIDAETRAGTTSVATTSGSATGPAIPFVEVAGPPAAIVLECDDRVLVADGQALHEIRSAPLRDAFGNAVTDGTAVQLVVRDPVGVRRVPAVVVSDRIVATIEAPELPGPVVVEAIVGPVVSEPLTLPFLPAVTDIPAVVRTIEGRQVVEVGPVLDTLGAHLPDGTTVLIDGRALTLDGGIARIPLPGPGPIVVEVLGTRTTVRAAR